ncbi:MAG: PD40 domain-containing protein [Acidobacteria bacterium]|nr:PD40 domain-containing protein [Acidobacteriota bacterium]
MRQLRILLGVLPLLVTAQEPAHLGNIYQLTFGGQNAESYWAPDGKRLIFQSTRDGAACDQIYIMNADGSGVRMVSTGKGRTTCAYFLPDNQHIVYASTHDAGADCPPPPDRSRGYVWAVYPSYDLYLATDAGRITRRLTDQPGYDAEATVNWRTRKIIYTSMASGDLDLWSMNLDGGGRRRLTRDLGYDGGPVFSRDGKKIVWRAHRPATPAAVDTYKKLLADNLTAPMKMELYIADADGGHPKQLTSFGCAAFAPAFTPDGRRILFASNKNNCDGRQFELFLVDVDGKNLEQVTSFGGFTSFPEFSPDGKRLVFTSDRNAKQRYEFNIFVADWK